MDEISLEERIVAGLYIHIPFCQRRCLYCDFFSTTQLHRRKEYLQALLQEIAQRKDEAGEPIRTIYVGGGTPSTLEAEDIALLLQTVGTQDAEEITLELNPGDATPTYMRQLREAGFNRLSIGIQSFDDRLLQTIGRRHNAKQAVEAVQMAQQAGFANLSIDLMYALPRQTFAQWQADIETALQLNVQHISAYGLMYEQGTRLTQMRDAGDLQPMDEETEIVMYDYLCERLKQAGFEHYEVSNFALPGHQSMHNSAYWNATPYIGIGAGAHSYLPAAKDAPYGLRSWNPDDLDAYIRGIMAQDLQREKEVLSEIDRYNESVMLGLRTNKGIIGSTSAQYRSNIGPISEDKRAGLLIQTDDGRLVATQKGLHVLNRIIEQLMIDE